MNIDFDMSQVLAAEFGVGRRIGEDVEYSLLPADDTVQEALLGEAKTTLTDIAQQTAAPLQFDPGEKYSGNEYLVLPVQHELAASLMELHEVDRPQLDSPNLQRLRLSFCYFLRGMDNDGRRLTAINRASQFKATLGRQGRLVILSDSLRVIPDPVMQLNAGFDIVIEGEFVHILHPASFRALANVDEAIAQAVPRNVEAISRAAPYVEWANIEEYAVGHPRAASLLSSIRTQGYAESVDKAELESLCGRTGVSIDNSGGQIVVPDNQVLAFLEIVDRRRYEIGLVPGTSERYRASSRARLGRS